MIGIVVAFGGSGGCGAGEGRGGGGGRVNGDTGLRVRMCVGFLEREICGNVGFRERMGL